MKNQELKRWRKKSGFIQYHLANMWNWRQEKTSIRIKAEMFLKIRKQLKISLNLLLFLQILFFSGRAAAQQPVTENFKINKSSVQSDGCTAWFNADYKDCCVEHDLAYLEENGHWRRRLRADNRLFLCVAAKKGLWHKLMAPMMWSGVRVFGSDLLPVRRTNIIHKFSKRTFRFLTVH